MRISERIPIFLRLIKPKLKDYLKEIIELDDKTADNWEKAIKVKWVDIRKEWLTYPDLRFGQVLQIFGLYKEGFWYYKEESIVLSQLGIPLKEYALWGTKGKNGTSKLKYKLLKDLETDHLKAILETQTNISTQHKDLIKEILHERVSTKD